MQTPLLQHLFGLSGKVALVTGGTSGIGLASARALAAAGAEVIVCSDWPEDVEAFAVAGARAVHHRLSDRRAAEGLIGITGPLDILVSNAGIEGPVGGTGDCSEQDYLRVFDINLHSAYWLSAAARQGMAQRGGGAIILMSSLSALRGNTKIGPYSMTKAALSQLARNLAVELGPDNIRANAIAPGLIETPFAAGLMQNADFMKRRLTATPLGRVGQPDEVAAALLFLAGSGGAFTTGQTLVVDGGTLISDGA